MKVFIKVFFLFALLSFSCKQEGVKQVENKLNTFIEKNMILLQGGTIIGKTQNSFDFGTTEEFWYGTFINNRIVTLSPYYIGRYEVTWGLWNEVREKAKGLGYVIGKGQSGSDSANDAIDQPVTDITWYDAVVWCNALTHLISGSTQECSYIIEEKEIAKDSSNLSLCEKITFDTSKKGFRLPTEAEWEMAARLETEKTDYATNYSNGDAPIYLININHLSGAKKDFNDVEECSAVAWHKNNAVEETAFVTRPVGKLKSNGIGAFDMSGNVCEWCYDYHAKIEEQTITNPTGPKTGKWKITRGGYMKAAPIYCIPSYRCYLAQKPTSKNDDMGFRLASYK